jgi:uncharacterized protein YbjT (DUF2867 family)
VAAKATGLTHVIWSTLEDTRKFIPLSDNRMPTLQGRYKVPHCDAKGESNHIFTDLAVPVTFLQTSFYWENLISFGAGPRKGPDGTLVISLPMGDKKLPGIAVDDIAGCGKEFIGRTVSVAGEHLTCVQMASLLSRSLGREVRYHEITPDVYRSFGFPGADNRGNMYQFNRDFEKEFCGVRDLKASRALNPALQTFEQWLAKNAGRIPVE